jgi:hypothetical protein
MVNLKTVGSGWASINAAETTYLASHYSNPHLILSLTNPLTHVHRIARISQFAQKKRLSDPESRKFWTRTSDNKSPQCGRRQTGKWNKTQIKQYRRL